VPRPARLEPLDPPAQPLDVRTAACVKLVAEAHIEAGSTDDIGHEGVAGHEAATGERDCEGADVHAVTLTGSSLGKVAPQRRFEALPALTLDRAALARERRAGGELA
jgi:hypothetical protein